MFIDVPNFGPFAGDGSVESGSPRGGPSNRGNRGGVSDVNKMTGFLRIRNIFV